MKLFSYFKNISAYPERRRIDREIDGLADYDLSGYKRIYLIHIRKTGGTSINNMFLSLGDKNDPASFYQDLAGKSDHRLIRNGKVFVGWNKRYINKGKYFYAFSHIPLHHLKLPEGTFTVTCFRDPAKRVISHYRMLNEFSKKEIEHPCMKLEGKWLGSSFDDFLDRIPKEHLLNQLYMFSGSFDVNRAFERIMNVSHHFFTEDFAKGIQGLNEKLGLNLDSIHIRKTEWNCKITQHNLDRLREMINEEYLLLDMVRDNRAH